MLIPSMTGHGLVNLVAELEHRLTGSALAPLLESTLADQIPEGPTVVFALFDGLGADQVRHVPDLRRSLVDVLHAPFPTTTTVSLATVASGRVAAGHGILGHLMWLPDLESVVNVLKFVTPDGRSVATDTTDLLPGQTLWERLREAGVEPITVQPAGFQDSPLSRAFYRGCRFEPVWTMAEMIEATVQLSATPGRFVFTYWPDIDVAAHVTGSQSDAYRRAVKNGARLWTSLTERVAGPVVGTADHGHLDYRESGKRLLRGPRMKELTWYGDSRSLMVRGDSGLATALLAGTDADTFGAEEFRDWFGEDQTPHPQLAARLPDLVALAPDDTLLLPPGFDRRLIGYHGGLRREEVEIPLLVSPGAGRRSRV